jgi:SAM-dependent methyltransferase
MAAHLTNDEQAEYWNGNEAEHWLDHEDRYDAMLHPFIDRLLSEARVSGSDRILDVGCGTGAITRAAARRVPEREILGIDLSRQLLERGAQRARTEGLANVRFEQADAQTYRFRDAGFASALSRFGLMFFAEPLGGFANICQALRPGGRLAFVCWAEAMDNEWLAVPGVAAAQCIELPSLGGPGSPGPFSLSDRDHLAALVDAAGFVGVDVQAVSEPLLLGTDPADTVEFLKATGFGRRMLIGLDGSTVQRVTDVIATALEPYVTPNGVYLGSKSWLVTAERPAERGTNVRT